MMLMAEHLDLVPLSQSLFPLPLAQAFALPTLGSSLAMPSIPQPTLLTARSGSLLAAAPASTSSNPSAPGVPSAQAASWGAAPPVAYLPPHQPQHLLMQPPQSTVSGSSGGPAASNGTQPHLGHYPPYPQLFMQQQQYQPGAQPYAAVLSSEIGLHASMPRSARLARVACWQHGRGSA